MGSHGAGQTRHVLLRPVGPHALLAEVSDAAQALALATWARAADVAAVEVVPGACTVLLDGLSTAGAEALRARLATWTAPEPGDVGTGGRLVEVAVDYDGPDLAFVAERWGTDLDGVVARHTGTDFVSSFCGFSPGFAYLTGLPGDLAVPRLDSPRAGVPAGAVALAGAWCGVYPTASPGGWRIIGRTDAVLWDVTRPDPALLSPGTRVRFVRA